MQKHLEILLDEEEHREIQSAARREGLTVSEWVRKSLRVARQDHVAAIESKLRAITAASQHRFPTTDIQTMLSQSTPR